MVVNFAVFDNILLILILIFILIIIDESLSFFHMQGDHELGWTGEEDSR